MSNSFVKTVKVKNDISKITNATIKDLQAALYLEAELVMTTAKRDYVPVVTGNLRNSGTVSLPEVKGDTVQVKIGFGGASAPYAAVVHEYPKGYGQGKNKYLSQPLNISAKNMTQRIAKHIRRSINARLGRATP